MEPSAPITLTPEQPDMREKLFDTINQQPPKIAAEMVKFSDEFDRALGLSQD